MKKKILFFALAIISSLTISLPTFAETLDNAPKYLWTIPELIELKEKFDTERDTTCNGDLECEENLRFELLEHNEAYNAADSFSNMIFMVTSINPSTSTVRVLFHDEDPEMRRMGEANLMIVDEVYIAWFSEEPVMFNSYYANSHYDMEMYMLFSDSTSTRGYKWLKPNQEIDFQINYPEALLKSPHYVYFTIDGDNVNVTGMHDYSNCIESPLYKEGMECRMAFDSFGGFDFYPFWPGSNRPVEEAPLEDGYGGAPMGDNAIDTPTNNASTTESKIPNEDGNVNSGDNSIDIAYVKTDSASTDIPGQPETGSPTNMAHKPRKLKNEEFPWCLTLIIVLSGIFLWWWFLPEKRAH